MGKWRHGAGISAPRINLFSLLTSKLSDLIQTLGSAKEGALNEARFPLGVGFLRRNANKMHDVVLLISIVRVQLSRTCRGRERRSRIGITSGELLSTASSPAASSGQRTEIRRVCIRRAALSLPKFSLVSVHKLCVPEVLSLVVGLSTSQQITHFVGLGDSESWKHSRRPSILPGRIAVTHLTALVLPSTLTGW